MMDTENTLSNLYGIFDNFLFSLMFLWCVGSWIVHDAMKWDDETMKITDSIPGEMNPVCDHFHASLITNTVQI